MPHNNPNSNPLISIMISLILPIKNVLWRVGEETRNRLFQSESMIKQRALPHQRPLTLHLSPLEFNLLRQLLLPIPLGFDEAKVR